jgi:histidinol dehydrogenase
VRGGWHRAEIGPESARRSRRSREQARCVRDDRWPGRLRQEEARGGQGARAGARRGRRQRVGSRADSSAGRPDAGAGCADGGRLGHERRGRGACDGDATDGFGGNAGGWDGDAADGRGRNAGGWDGDATDGFGRNAGGWDGNASGWDGNASGWDGDASGWRGGAAGGDPARGCGAGGREDGASRRGAGGREWCGGRSKQRRRLRERQHGHPEVTAVLRQLSARSPEAAALLDRSTRMAEGVDDQVAAIVADVRARRDAAVAEYTLRFDRREPLDGSYELSRERWDAHAARVAPAVRDALHLAAHRIRAFHERQLEPDVDVTLDGVRLELRVTPLARVGLYVPGGTARYPSSVLMTAIPAKVAGVPEVVMVTPGASDEALLAARIAGVDRVFELGGAQAVAALAFGTETVPRVDKIVGPGNAWVASAKRQVYGEVDIDSIAGPSEVLIIADGDANPAWVAADLIAQAEHDTEARAILVTTSAALASAVDAALIRQLDGLPRKGIAEQAIAAHGAAVIVDSVADAVAFANRFAPEHLELQCADAREVATTCTTAGAIFIGPYASEAAGDYLAGGNHVLPTGGAARYASPLGVHDFRKRTSLIEYDAAAAAAHADAIAALAACEGLDGHGRAALLRGAK